MKALRVDKKKAAVREVDKPAAGGEALVRVLLSGICNTDLEIARGYAGFKGTIGHEFVGIVEESPDAKQVGTRVVGEINAGCGECELCRAGDPRHCGKRTVLGIVGRDGAHAEFLRLPTINLHPVPDMVLEEHAVFAEPLAAACGIMERVAIDDSKHVAVIGDGKLGLLCAQVIALTGAGVLLIGKHAEKLRIAERRGIETASPKVGAARKREFDVVVEASGSPSGFVGALELLKPRGTLVLKSTFQGPGQLDEIDQARLVVDEISIVGSRCGRIQPALDLLKKGAIDIDGLISEEYSLARGVHALERAGKKGILKVFLRP
ncbi:MAG TPA: alcohol dehydrogenase catalytic domain-containing protein [Pyrinomonadaceae bacterium]|jgi:threonine dehydrogenase-like Zn-dependent dehydrogenase|nr:alcohol dehydrogenase catalytic domain-containing protein [Pyrinomonadaceae bacterium]